MIFLFVTILFVLEALYEALYDRGIKTVSGYIELLYKTITLSGLFLWLYGYNLGFLEIRQDNLIMFLVGVVLYRYMIFDPIYNFVRGNSLFYIGTTKTYDRLLRKLLKWAKQEPTYVMSLTKLVLGVLGIHFMGETGIATIIGFIFIGIMVLFAVYSVIYAIIYSIKKYRDEKEGKKEN